jgi:hypothetical protein
MCRIAHELTLHNTGRAGQRRQGIRWHHWVDHATASQRKCPAIHVFTVAKGNVTVTVQMMLNAQVDAITAVAVDQSEVR